MFLGMFLLHIGVMPFVMIETPRDYRISLNQTYMGIHMASWMVVLEATMHSMPFGGWIFTLFSLVLSALAIRFQWFISDQQYIRDMIPHHSMAILTSKEILKKTQNPKIHFLATNILQTQRDEITQMSDLENFPV